MALYSRKEWCELLGVKTGDLSNYIKRQVVFVSQGEGGEVFDDTLPANADFKRRRTQLLKERGSTGLTMTEAGRGQKVAKVRENVKKRDRTPGKRAKNAKSVTKGKKLPEKSKKGVQGKTTPKNSRAEKQGGERRVSGPPVFVQPSKEDLLLMSIQTRNKYLESEKLEQEIRLSQMRMDKQLGEVVPTEVVKGVFSGYARGITDKTKQIFNDLLVDLGQKNKLNSTEVAEMRGSYDARITKAIAECVEEGKNNVENIVNEYSDKKGRGERN